MDGSRSILAGVSIVIALVALSLSLLVLLAPAHPNVSPPVQSLFTHPVEIRDPGACLDSSRRPKPLGTDTPYRTVIRPHPCRKGWNQEERAWR